MLAADQLGSPGRNGENHRKYPLVNIQKAIENGDL